MTTEYSEFYMHLQWGAVIGTSLVAAIWDIRTRRIPNNLTLPFLLIGIFWSGYTGGAWGFIESILSGIVIALPFLFLYAFAGGGAGDVKLMAGIGAWLGFATGLSALALIILSGGVIGCIFAIYKGQFKAIYFRTRKLAQAMIATLVLNKGKGFSGAGSTWVDPKTMTYMPYGLAIFCGVCISSTGVSLWPL